MGMLGWVSNKITRKEKYFNKDDKTKIKNELGKIYKEMKKGETNFDEGVQRLEKYIITDIMNKKGFTYENMRKSGLLAKIRKYAYSRMKTHYPFNVKKVAAMSKYEDEKYKQMLRDEYRRIRVFHKVKHGNEIPKREAKRLLFEYARAKGIGRIGGSPLQGPSNVFRNLLNEVIKEESEKPDLVESMKRRKELTEKIKKGEEKLSDDEIREFGELNKQLYLIDERNSEIEREKKIQNGDSYHVKGAAFATDTTDLARKELIIDEAKNDEELRNEIISELKETFEHMKGKITGKEEKK